MGLFDVAKAGYTGQKAYRTHVAGNQLADAGKPEEAKERYREALDLYAQTVRYGNDTQKILHAYAVLLMREGRMQEAHDLMVRSSKMKNMTPDDWYQLRFQFSIYQWRVGEVDKAIETIRRAAAHKMNGAIYSALGMFLVDRAEKTGDFAEAIEFNEKALDYDDEDPATLDNMGQLNEALSRAEADPEKAAEYRAAALDFYKRAHKIKPRQITTMYNLARLLHEDGEDDKARKVLSIRNTLYYSGICPVTREMMDALAAEIG